MENDVLDDGMQHDHLHVTEEAKMYLAETAKWAKFLAIVGFVFVGLMIIGALSIGTIMGKMASGMGEAMGPMAGMTGFLSFFYIIMALLYLAPCWYLLKFANATKAALASDNSLTLTQAFENHKSVYKFWGIMMIVILGFYALMIVIGIIGAVAM